MILLKKSIANADPTLSRRAGVRHRRSSHVQYCDWEGQMCNPGTQKRSPLKRQRAPLGTPDACAARVAGYLTTAVEPCETLLRGCDCVGGFVKGSRRRIGRFAERNIISLIGSQRNENPTRDERSSGIAVSGRYFACSTPRVSTTRPPPTLEVYLLERVYYCQLKKITLPLCSQICSRAFLRLTPVPAGLRFLLDALRR